MNKKHRTRFGYWVNMPHCSATERVKYHYENLFLISKLPMKQTRIPPTGGGLSDASCF